jgi:hypothetical protein
MCKTEESFDEKEEGPNVGFRSWIGGASLWSKVKGES